MRHANLCVSHAVPGLAERQAIRRILEQAIEEAEPGNAHHAWELAELFAVHRYSAEALEYLARALALTHDFPLDDRPALDVIAAWEGRFELACGPELLHLVQYQLAFQREITRLKPSGSLVSVPGTCRTLRWRLGGRNQGCPVSG